MSGLPLYKPETDDYFPSSLQATAHAGLWYDKFFNQYNDSWKVIEPNRERKGGKVNWINSVAGSPVGDPAQVGPYAERVKKLVEALGGCVREFQTEWHFVTGLGLSHPVENGFAWHRTLGVPYLTGAAVKGMLRAYVLCWDMPEGCDPDDWFGDADDAGGLIFFDAIPTSQVKLIADVMTPHMGKWYENGDSGKYDDGTNVPADWHDPKPIPFLAVAPKQTFQFAIGKRPGFAIDMKVVMDTLKDALNYVGAGAKTAVGYGRFSETQKSIAEQQRREKETDRDPLAEFKAWFESQKFSASNKGEHGKLIERLKALPDIEAGKLFVKQFMKKADCAPRLWEILNSGG